jgi:toxin HigB-1
MLCQTVGLPLCGYPLGCHTGEEDSLGTCSSPPSGFCNVIHTGDFNRAWLPLPPTDASGTPARRSWAGTFSPLCRIALYNPLRYSANVIKSFGKKETRKIWQGQYSKRLPQDIQQLARRKLRLINNARTLTDLRLPPANRLEPLRGRRAGQHSIRINDQWRICFIWKAGQVFDVEIVDYH